MKVSDQVAISVEALSVFAGRKRLLGPIAFRVEKGGTLVIMGETGAGKSLIAQAILGSLPETLRAEGRIEVNGRRVDTLGSRMRAALWGRELATLPQEPWRALDPLMRAWPQVGEAYRFVAGLPRGAAEAGTREAFDTLGLQGAERRLPGALSGGMAQRVAFAAATAGRAPILLADEPTKGLDAARHATVVGLLAQVPQTGGTLLAITHEVAVARRLGGEVIILKDGAVVEQGRARAVLTAPKAPYTKALLDADPQSWPHMGAHQPGGVVLTVKDLAIARAGRPLVAGFDLTLQAGERVAITGPSGIGKTSLLDALAGLLKPARGTVRRAPHLARTAVQKLYQDPPAAFPTRIPLGRSLRDVARLHGVDWSRVTDNLGRLGVPPALLDRFPDAVSGGELQRISIARTLTVGPKVLLADEPTSRLDPITQRGTLALLAEIAEEQEIAVILVTHDITIADRWANRRIALDGPRN